MPGRWWRITALVVLVAAAAIVSFGGWSRMSDKRTGEVIDQSTPLPPGLERATFGGGCFWCTEAVYRELKGVESVVSGYSGGHVPDPTYRQVCGGATGHAEVIHVTFDPKITTYTELLEVFWQTHDPITLNRQGHDVGPQYRSVVFYHNEEQRRQADEAKRALDASGAFAAPIVTEIAPFTVFYPAEDYHQNYFAENGRQPYCSSVIRSKVEKFRKVFREKLRTP